MIYLVKGKEYKGIEHSAISKEDVEFFFSKGASIESYYTPPGFKDEEWEDLVEDEKKKYGNISLPTAGILIAQKDYIKYFKHLEVLSVIDQDVVTHEINIDLEALADKVMNKVVKNARHLFNSKLEIHQPNMPLFQYNNYKVEYDFCTQALQDEINKGWRVVCVCPQPDQRRPDYILGKYIAEAKEV